MKNGHRIALVLALAFGTFGVPAYGQTRLAWEHQVAIPASFVTRWVNSAEGLRVRDKPSLEGKVVAALRFGTQVAIEETGPAAGIDGLAGAWLLVATPTARGWVFGGYLAAYDPVEMLPSVQGLLGVWTDDAGGLYEFRENGQFGQDSGRTGHWSLEGEDLEIALEGGIVSPRLLFLSSNRAMIEYGCFKVFLYRMTDSAGLSSLDDVSGE